MIDDLYYQFIKQFDLLVVNHNNKYMSSKAAEILRALNSQIEHQKSSPNHPLAPISELNIPAIQTKLISNPTLSQKLIDQNQIHSISIDAKIKYQNSQKAPQFLTEMLKQQKNSLHKDIFNKIDGYLREKEKNAYFGLATAQDQYLQVLVQQVKNKQAAQFDVINGLMAKRTGKVEVDLEQGNLFVQHQKRNLSNKKQLERLHNIDVAKMIKIKDGQLRSKMDILSHKLQQLGNIESWDLEADKRINQEIQKKLAENMDSNNYALDSERTKIAKDYVKHMQQQRMYFQKRKKERQAQYQKQEAERQAELKQADQMKDLAKRQQIMQKIEARKKKRQQEQKQQEAQEQQAKKILAQYHRKLPIFKTKQKQFQQKFVKPQQQRRQQKLNQIREERRSLSLHQIKKHESLYLNRLKSQRTKRKQQISLILKSRQAEDRKKDYYKGSAHARIKQMTKEDILRNYSLREASKLKANRMKEYGEVIHKNHQPTVDEQKKKELQKAIEQDIMKKKHARKIFKQVVDETSNQVKFQSYFEEIPEKNLYKQGNRLFQQARKNIKKKDLDSTKEKTSQVQPSKLKLLSNSNSENQKKSLNLWELRAKQLQQMASSQIVDAKNFDHLKKNIQNLDSKAAQKEDLLKKVQLTMQQNINQKNMLDHYYLHSIRQKMKLLE